MKSREIAAPANRRERRRSARYDLVWPRAEDCRFVAMADLKAHWRCAHYPLPNVDSIANSCRFRCLASFRSPLFATCPLGFKRHLRQKMVASTSSCHIHHQNPTIARQPELRPSRCDWQATFSIKQLMKRLVFQRFHTLEFRFSATNLS